MIKDCLPPKCGDIVSTENEYLNTTFKAMNKKNNIITCETPASRMASIILMTIYNINKK